MSQNTEQVHIVALAVPLQKFAEFALMLESEFLTHPQGSRVIAEDGARDAVQIEFIKGKPQAQFACLCAEAFSALRRNRLAGGPNRPLWHLPGNKF
jgi:hypothetical protein